MTKRLSDNDILMLVQTAELNAGSKAASIHQKELFAALKELYERRLGTYEAPLPEWMTKVQPQDGNVVIGQDQTLTFTKNAPQMVLEVKPPLCPKCNGWYFSIPRMGIFHVCTDKVEFDFGKDK